MFLWIINAERFLTNFPYFYVVQIKGMKFKKHELKEFLDEKVELYNRPSFIDADPISIPHRFTGKEDIEVSGFLAATIAWGRRDLIIRSSNILLEAMDNKPYEFIMTSDIEDLKRLSCFVHRTFNSSDCIYFIKGLRNIYRRYDSMEDAIIDGMKDHGGLIEGIMHLRGVFFQEEHDLRTEKHFADIKRGAAGKRINMFFRIIKVASNQNKLYYHFPYSVPCLINIL
jgi:hypothetical protein